MISRRRLLGLGLGAGLLAIILPSAAQYGGKAVVQGQVMSRKLGAPVPGLRAVLVHPVLGRSAASFTNAQGHFGWSGIAVRPEPYQLELYWGQNLVYRQPNTVSGQTLIPVITL